MQVSTTTEYLITAKNDLFSSFSPSFYLLESARTIFFFALIHTIVQNTNSESFLILLNILQILLV